MQSQEFGSSVLKINWPIFSPKFNKQLLIMTLRGVKPIIVSGGYFIVLSLDTFTKVKLVIILLFLNNFLINKTFVDNESFLYSL